MPGRAGRHLGGSAGCLGSVSVFGVRDSGSWGETGERARVEWTDVPWRGGLAMTRAGSRRGVSGEFRVFGGRDSGWWDETARGAWAVRAGMTGGGGFPVMGVRMGAGISSKSQFPLCGVPIVG